jgi:hypothetical protein
MFSIFVFYQQLHVKNFNGASRTFPLFLNFSALLGMLVGIAFLLYYGWNVVWWAPIVILVIGVVTTIFGVFVERLVGATVISVAGFVGWPICAFFMFHFMPKAA